ncbi:MAG TPA: 4-(cytidine 5'-diphospho)-2-C-methyl-D-erythritol kinase [Sphingobacteriaceae bacterium]|nr:4-(cytidine 5'-diphospho)-2-C-methyl-D-erythritol kinase [Sphingobacteriaceae bacterium]
MITFPNAKINIGLNIISRRGDGYHNLETVFYPVGIKDALEVIEADKLSFTSSGIVIPGNYEENLCLKAYYLMRQDVHIPPVHIHLHKHIPIGAGMGGGSADAAFFIHLLNDKFQLNLNRDQLSGYARQLGSDCAFFIDNVPAFAHGRGEQLEEIKLDLSGYYMVLVQPPVHISTAEAYRHVEPQVPEMPLKELIQLPVKQWKNKISNDFESSIIKNHPEINELKKVLYLAGALYAAMSGSGSSVYGIFREKVELKHLENNNEVFYGI